MSQALLSLLSEQATALGFVRLGVARAEPLGVEAQRLRAYIAAGRHGEMDYMARTEAVRCDPRHAGMLPSAVSVVVLVTPYGAGEPCRAVPGRMARYARSRDYHNVLHKRLRKLAKLLREAGHEVRAAVDSMPVFERAWAQRAGVGFVGKNCCLIVPGLGSHVFLSALITSAQLPESSPMAPRCGACSACLSACPTQAFAGPHELDGRRCISYLTIEQRGAIPEALRPQVQDWVFGCDACQDVCPFNRSPRALWGDAAFADPRFSEPAETYLQYSEEEFLRRTEGSPLRRTGRAGMARNAAVVLGNVGTRRHLPVLEQSSKKDADEVVREAAAWAVARIVERGA